MSSMFVLDITCQLRTSLNLSREIIKGLKRNEIKPANTVINNLKHLLYQSQIMHEFLQVSECLLNNKSYVLT